MYPVLPSVVTIPFRASHTNCFKVITFFSTSATVILHNLVHLLGLILLGSITHVTLYILFLFIKPDKIRSAPVPTVVASYSAIFVIFNFSLHPPYYLSPILFQPLDLLFIVRKYLLYLCPKCP